MVNGLELKILKVTIREVKAYNRVSVKRFNILANCRVQFFLFPQNLKFLNTFLDLLIIHIRFDLPRSGNPYLTTKHVKLFGDDVFSSVRMDKDFLKMNEVTEELPVLVANTVVYCYIAFDIQRIDLSQHHFCYNSETCT